MNAYIKFKPYNKDFYTDDFAKGVVMGNGTKSFESVLRLHGGTLQGGKLKKTLADQHAIYLYGGRKALVRAFTAFKNNVGDFVVKAPDTCWLTVYHGKITVGTLNNKTKRILMILSYKKTSRVPLDVNDLRLRVDLYEYQNGEKTNVGFYTHLDFAGLKRIVRALPE